MVIRRSTVTAVRPTPDAEFTAAVSQIRIHQSDEDALLRSVLETVWAAVESHTGRLWVSAENDGERTAVAELWADGCESVPLMPGYPETRGAVSVTAERWTDGAWVARTDLERADPWTFTAPLPGSYRVTSTYAAEALPEHVQRAVLLAASFYHENRGDIHPQVQDLTASALLRSGAADLLRHDRRLAL